MAMRVDRGAVYRPSGPFTAAVKTSPPFNVPPSGTSVSFE